MGKDRGREVWQREKVSSPCVNVCVIHPEARLCTGCLRSLDEIAGWSRMSEEERRAIMAELPSRGPLKATRRGGRRGRLSRG
ncbi:DUF1289 domain-containing protein [Pseudooceanicola sp. CBS1P-1]|uniref:DUF1289 domain-containing protein n=1 Tax=Pseudooceanicola albus TaxID=2692189 RepID=A0A6L7FZX7_9RHOB|nr:MULTISPECIES: DUF1289 domain-containing protein [Pseudooceanicola]MBT9382298.1 DUF1289 domain-containing protein [Pseudooceanicola endophyticus]MXN16840.1 DUF1289 domain-containing protein [Pseudooceanicola albus]